MIRDLYGLLEGDEIWFKRLYDLVALVEYWAPGSGSGELYTDVLVEQY